MTISQDVSSFVASVYGQTLPETLIAKAKEHIMDTIGVSIGASKDPIASALQGFLLDADSSNYCSVLGSSLKASVANAALANGTLAHGLDFDDSSWRLIGHPSAAVLPAVLAIAERFNHSGLELITAYVLGTEVSCKLGLNVEPELYERGWHATSIMGVLGATAGCSYLLGLDEEHITNAIGIAASLSSGLRENFGTMTKPFHAGAAAQHGVTAALLAKHGFTSRTTSLDGQWGLFMNVTAGKRSSNFSFASETFEVLQPGFFIKPYPSCAATHTGIDATLALVSEYNFSWRDVESIAIGSGPVGPIMLFYNQPNKGTEGKFSAYFTVASAIVDGKVGLDTFVDEQVKRPEIVELISRTNFYIAEEFANRSIDEAPAIVSIRLKNGQEIQRKVENPLGSPQNPMSLEQLIAKYRDCTQRVLPMDNVEKSLTILLNLEMAVNLQDLLANLTR